VQGSPEQKSDAAMALIMAPGGTISGQADEADMSDFLAQLRYL
jgi:hypothetical protein